MVKINFGTQKQVLDGTAKKTKKGLTKKDLLKLKDKKLLKLKDKKLLKSKDKKLLKLKDKKLLKLKDKQFGGVDSAGDNKKTIFADFKFKKQESSLEFFEEFLDYFHNKPNIHINNKTKINLDDLFNIKNEVKQKFSVYDKSKKLLFTLTKDLPNVTQKHFHLNIKDCDKTKSHNIDNIINNESMSKEDNLSDDTEINIDTFKNVKYTHNNEFTQKFIKLLKNKYNNNNFKIKDLNNNKNIQSKYNFKLTSESTNYTNSGKYINIVIDRFKVPSKKNETIIILNDDIKINDVDYYLHSFVCHTGGTTRNSGHYVAYFRVYSDSSKKKIIEFNDSSFNDLELKDDNDIHKKWYYAIYKKGTKPNSSNNLDLTKIGFNNDGFNYCYINSALQILLRIHEIWDKVKNNIENILIQAYKLLYYNYFKKKNIGTVIDKFRYIFFQKYDNIFNVSNDFFNFLKFYKDDINDIDDIKKKNNTEYHNIYNLLIQFFYSLYDNMQNNEIKHLITYFNNIYYLNYIIEIPTFNRNKGLRKIVFTNNNIFNDLMKSTIIVNEKIIDLINDVLSNFNEIDTDLDEDGKIRRLINNRPYTFYTSKDYYKYIDNSNNKTIKTN